MMYNTRLILAIASVLLTINLVQGEFLAGQGYEALQFNGSTWAQIPRGLANVAGKEFSFEAWILVPIADTHTIQQDANRPIVSRFNTSVPFPDNNINDFDLQVNVDGYVVFFVGGSYDLGFVMISNNRLEDNRWYHVGFSIEYDDIQSAFPKRAELWVDSWYNGVNVRDYDDALWFGPGYPRNVLSNEFIALGHYANNDPERPKQFFIGNIDEARFWRGRRLGSDFLTFANRTVNDNMKDLWTATPDVIPGGTSSNELVAAYNFNEDLSQGVVTTLHDQGRYHFDATIQHGPLNHVPKFVASDVKLVTFAYAVGEIPVQIQLYGIDRNNVSNKNFNFKLYIDSAQIRGEVYKYDPDNSGTPVNANPKRPGGITTPGIGEIVNNYDIVETDSVVYVFIPNVGSSARFYYTVTDGVSESERAEVRISISCNTEGDIIDHCGVCNGFNSTLDECGICFGDSQTCAGCDHVPNSGAGYDECGLCGGHNDTCLGCDGEINSGIEYDECGVCGGSNDQCLGCDGIPNGASYDECGVCGGHNDTCVLVGCDSEGNFYDECGVCGGHNETCLGCDGVANSGTEYDECGVCDGSNESCMGCDGVLNSPYVYDSCGVCGGNGGTCEGCDGSGGGEYDICGVCRGDGSSCGACIEDACGVPCGDNSTCTCKLYHGYEVQELEYILLQYGLNHTIDDLNTVIGNLDQSLELLENYSGDLDLASVVLYFNEFLGSTLANYEESVDKFIRELDISLGLIYVGKPWNPID